MKTEKRSFFTLREMVFIAVFAALMCIVAPVTIPIQPVGISLGTFAIYFAGAMLGAKRGAAAVLVYVALGTAGLPVFTNYMGGIAKVLGPTGGFIAGFFPLVIITGIFSDMQSKKHWTVPAGMVLGTLIMYALATVWYMFQSGCSLGTALVGCVVPFLPGDSLKIAAATALAIPLRSKLTSIMNGSREA